MFALIYKISELKAVLLQLVKPCIYFSSGALLILAFSGCNTLAPEAAATESAAATTPVTGIHEAALLGNIEAIQQHINSGADLNEKDAFGSTPLLIATTFGHTEVATALIAAGADLEATSQDLSTPLHVAALLGRTEIARNMLNKGINRFLRNNTGATAFDITAGPFEADIPIYAKLAQALGPLGLQLDYEQIKANRATIAQLLKPDPAELHAINYTPVELDDWQISTPQKQGLDPALIAELYLDAAQLENLHSLLVIKNGYLIAENYSDRGAIDQKDLLQSVSKSYTSALVGIALDQGCLANVNQTMLRFFPELADTISDSRKHQITVQHLLQMRGGFPWEESAPALWEAVLSGSYLPRIETFSLTGDPGTLFNYSNLSSHWLGVIVARACHTDLKSFAQKYLFSPLKSQPGPWLKDRDGYYLGFAEMHFSAREVGRFGLMYLNSGKYKGQQIVPASWVRDSLTNYSDDAWIASNRETKVGRYFRDLGYGYQWWSATINEQHVDFAWGHGGQLIVLLKNHNMVLVTTAYPFYGESNNRSWRHERAVFNLVGKFIQALSH